MGRVSVTPLDVKMCRLNIPRFERALTDDLVWTDPGERHILTEAAARR